MLQVFCSCKSNCTSARCSCKKSGLTCNQYCKSCQGQTCENASTTRFVLEEDENEYREEEDDDNDNDEEENNTESLGLDEDETVIDTESLAAETSSNNFTKKVSFCFTELNDLRLLI